jgi:hypothetical protein
MSVGEGGIRKERSLGKGDHSTGVEKDFGSSEYCRESEILGVSIVAVHRGCWGFWARRARISVDILGLGS